MATQRSRRSTQPQIASPYASLEALARAALNIYGESAPSTVDGMTYMQFIQHGNAVLDDVMIHPYWDGGEIQYYFHPSDTRPVSDNVVMMGILAKFALAQKSKAAAKYEAEYLATLNKVLLRVKFGGNPAWEISAPDRKSGGA